MRSVPNVYRVVVAETYVNKQLEEPRFNLEDNIKTDLKDCVLLAAFIRFRTGIICGLF